MRGDDWPNNGELGVIVLSAPLWIPLVAALGAVWCVGWLARAVYRLVASAWEVA